MKNGLIITPFDAAGTRVRDTVARALRKAAFTILSPEASGATSPLSAFLETIRNADLVVADVSRSNPSVYYEVGFAHALRVPTLLLHDAETSEGLPSDLRGHVFIPYRRSNLSQLDRLVVAAVERLSEEVEE